jgi:hypothetical protein
MIYLVLSMIQGGTKIFVGWEDLEVVGIKEFCKEACLEG